MRGGIVRFREFLKNRDGSMAVEFVAIVPWFVAALVISFEFGRAFWAYDVVTRDVRAAVRYLSRDAASVPPFASNACPAASINMAKTGSPTDTVNTHFPWTGVTSTFSCPVAQTISASQYNDAGYVIRMDVSVPITLSLLVIANRLTGSSIPTYPLTLSYEARYIGN